MNIRLLESKMALHGDTNGALANYLGLTPQSFSLKKHERMGRQFTKKEMSSIKERYNLTPQEMNDIFFAEVVAK